MNRRKTTIPYFKKYKHSYVFYKKNKVWIRNDNIRLSNKKIGEEEVKLLCYKTNFKRQIVERMEYISHKGNVW